MQIPNQNMNRREFFVNLLIILGSILTIIVSIPVIGSLFSPLLKKKPRVWRPVGKVEDFVVDKTVLVKFTNADPQPWSGVTEESASWLRRVSENEFIAFSINCTHLGCPVRWNADAELFLCPCHGGVYYKNGNYAAGPPPHDLYRYPVRINNGNVEILTSPLPITTD